MVPSTVLPPTEENTIFPHIGCAGCQQDVREFYINVKYEKSWRIYDIKIYEMKNIKKLNSNKKIS